MCEASYITKYKTLNTQLACLSAGIAKKLENIEEETSNSITKHVTYHEIIDYIQRNNIILDNYTPLDFKEPPFSIGETYCEPGGLKSCISHYTDKAWVKQIEGPEEAYPYLIEVASRYKNGEILPDVVDILNCDQGCNGGSGCCPYLSPLS